MSLLLAAEICKNNATVFLTIIILFLVCMICLKTPVSDCFLSIFNAANIVGGGILSGSFHALSGNDLYTHVYEYMEDSNIKISEMDIIDVLLMMMVVILFMFMHTRCVKSRQ